MPVLDEATAGLVEAVPARVVRAMLWARDGWPVFPLLPGDKVPFPGTRGVLDATTSPGQIVRWWTEHPDANIGGACAGRVVIDLDAYKPQFRADLASLRADGLVLPPTRTHRARGTHLIYRDTTGLPPEEIRGKLASTIDVKHGPAQYVVLPPSTHPDGSAYRVVNSRAEAAVPGGLLSVLRKPSGPVALADVPEALPLPDEVPEDIGEALVTQQADRSAHTWHVACAGYRAGLSDGQVRTLLEQDEVTQERWGEKPHKQWLELTEMLPRARQAAHRSSRPAVAPVSRALDSQEGRWPALPPEFWDARPHLAHIRQAAQSRRAAPDALLLEILGRIALLTHPRHQGPDNATLDLLGVVVAPPGTGKGTARRVAAGLVPGCEDPDGRVMVRDLGSGEGMTQAYFDFVEVDNGGAKPIRELQQVRYGVLFAADEGTSYTKLMQRSGQTTGEFLRKMFTGERQGGTYASEHNRRAWLDPRHYRGAVLLSIQPGVTSSLLGEWETGTPQRFLWMPGTDHSAPEKRPAWPGPLDWRPVGIDDRMKPDAPVLPIQVDDPIVAEIDAGRRRALMGEVTNKYDSHRNLLRLKVAILLAVLDGCLHDRREVGADDWQLAGLVLATSEAARSLVLGVETAKQEAEQTAKIGFAARRAGAETNARISAESSIRRVALGLQRYCKTHPGETSRTVRKSTRSTDRHLSERALDYAEANGLLVQDEEGRWHAP